MSGHMKKIIGPLIITIFFIVYYAGFAAICLVAKVIPLAVRLFFGFIPLVFIGVMIYVFLTRIKEIRSGEEDDLSQY